ncbi:MAG: selenocysteine-specific translation elongation factor SelB [Candidatus Solibacter sp.]|nr:selenocysteine-specific translation elongation factor SelB [Candidatus Solibacter sp.]
MKHIIVGTAGHIDHGKTALVKALTGIDADRLEEEKRRGITIDLGFAHLNLTPALRLGFVDVPGHERFVKNMLAGVGGIDLVLFVVAADESIKPQTREHFDICRLLDIPRGIIALTKSDLVDPDILGLVRMEVEELVAGSFLESAPIVPVSSVTGAGLDDLRRELARVASTVPEKNAAGHFRLPIDRVFTVKGFGTVATGTLISGTVAKDDEVELYPASRRLRVRGVQVHGSKSDRALAGQRTAVNLADIEPADLHRGDVLSVPDRFHAVTQLDCRLTLLPSAKPLKHRAPVHFHSGTAEIEAEVRLLQSTAAMRPGTTTYARLILREPALLLPGDRFIIRMFSPVVTIGGGAVVDIGARRYRKSDDLAARLDTLAGADNSARVSLLVRESPFGMSLDDLIARTGLTESAIVAAAAGAPIVAIPQPRPWYVDRAWMQSARDRIVKTVREFHQKNPLLPGIARQDLRAGAPPFLLDALIADAKEIVADADLVRSRAHKLVLKEDETQARAKIETAFESAGLAVPAVAEVLANSGVEPARARSLLQILLREKRLVRVSEDLVFHATAIDQLRATLAVHKGERFAVPAFKEWTNISRKYAIPLLEFLDRERLTRRDGDQRVIL